MKKKLTLLFTLMMGLLLLVACSSDDGSSSGAAKSPKKAKEGLNTISYEQLMKKLEDRDTFYLVTLDAKPELIKEKNVESDFDEELKKRGMKTFYVNLYDVDEEKKTSLNKDYLHSVMTTNGITWDVSEDGFVYVENGRVINLGAAHSFHEIILEDDGIDKKRQLQRKIDDLFEKSRYRGIVPKVE